MKGPMPLEDLPDYLRSLKNSGSLGDGTVVDMGTIVSPRRNWLLTVSYLSAAFLIVSAAALTTYNTLSAQNATVVLYANNIDKDAISKIMSDAGGRIVSVEQKNDSTYKVKFSTKKSLSSLIDWLRKNKDIKKVELEN